MGDATNMVLILGGELLKQAEQLLIMGLVPSEVVKGYELASIKAQTELESPLIPYHLYSNTKLTTYRTLHVQSSNTAYTRILVICT